MSRIRVPARAVPGVPRLGRLTAAEVRVWRAFPLGEVTDLRSGDPVLDDPARAGDWPAERMVRGEVIAALLLGACPAAAGAVGAVRIIGARITGELAFDRGQVSSLLLLQKCRFDGPVILDDAVTGSIDLSGSRLRTLSAYGAQVRGTLDLRDTVVTGEGPYSERTTLADRAVDARRAVNADGIRVEGSLFANRAEVTGSIGLINAHVGGQLTFIGTKLVNDVPGGESLNIGGIQVGRSLLAQALRTKGQLRMPGARIGSALLFRGALLDGAGRSALHGDSLSVAGEASFQSYRVAEEDGSVKDRPFTAAGSVRLLGARFGGGLDLTGARLAPPTAEPGTRARAAAAGTDAERDAAQPAAAPGQPPALLADRMVVEGNLRLCRLRTGGEIRLTGARITGHLDLRAMASPDALLRLSAATVVDGIQDGVRPDPQGPARPDNLSSWPRRLDLDGFVYGPFNRYLDARERLPLLARQVRRYDHDQVGRFRAQPYQQLAAYYRSLGSDGEARTVLLARQRALRAKLTWWQRIPGYLLDLLVGYGYRPMRAIGWAIGLLAASSLYFSRVRPERVSTDNTSVFNPVLYAADHLIPVIRFGQSDVWEYHGLPAVVTAVLTVLGWTLGIAIAAGATRTFNRN